MRCLPSSVVFQFLGSASAALTTKSQLCACASRAQDVHFWPEKRTTQPLVAYRTDAQGAPATDFQLRETSAVASSLSHFSSVVETVRRASASSAVTMTMSGCGAPPCDPPAPLVGSSDVDDQTLEAYP
ncbi:unnamed protein product [Chondrus crispus]|uniref:Uncharacterized protein n=1 Tax=Chondrus crispus TaxID=2769 RepID=R7QEF6_CHOCR|nr:unnamed protein product [Chondrus crispus]CDF36449.1 unnamed protein product [Chondrus crispus]|eukprot:XP_005716268.1 unnamed protein product [Chondrus crispus]